MWDLEDQTKFVRVLALEVPWAYTWADMRPGRTDIERRERLREAASEHLAAVLPHVSWWAFRIAVRKAGRRAFDVENVPKPIIDAFCGRQIARDKSKFAALALYPDDSVDHVRVIELLGERCTAGDSTRIEIFGFVG